MLNYIETLIAQVDPVTAYVILFVSAYFENTFPPIPGDTVTIFGAYLISTGHLSFTGVWLSTTFGSVAGFFTMFEIGYRFGGGFLANSRRAKIFHAEKVDRVRQWFSKYGYGVILANRFLSGTRSIISLFSGIFKLNRFYVIVLATVSAIIWNGLLMYAGYALGANWSKIVEILKNFNNIVIVLTILLIIGFFVFRFVRHKKEQIVKND